MIKLNGILIGLSYLYSNIWYARLALISSVVMFCSYTLSSIDSFPRGSDVPDIFIYASLMNLYFNVVNSAKLRESFKIDTKEIIYFVSIVLGLMSIILNFLMINDNYLSKSSYYLILSTTIMTILNQIFIFYYGLSYGILMTDTEIDNYRNRQQIFIIFNNIDYGEQLIENQPSDFSELIISDEEHNKIVNDQCSICLDNYGTDEKIVKLECSHLYHMKCITEWSKQKKECPICRSINIV